MYVVVVVVWRGVDNFLFVDGCVCVHSEHGIAYSMGGMRLSKILLIHCIQYIEFKIARSKNCHFILYLNKFKNPLRDGVGEIKMGMSNIHRAKKEKKVSSEYVA